MTEKTPKQSELAGTDTVDRANHNAKLDQLEEFRSDATGEALRTNQGVKIADNQNTLKAGDRGPSLLEDFIMREKLTHFDHERIPERIVHARGAAAHGVFQSYADHSWLTKASLRRVRMRVCGIRRPRLSMRLVKSWKRPSLLWCKIRRSRQQ